MPPFVDGNSFITMSNFTCKLSLRNDREVVYIGANEVEYPGEITLDELTKKLLARFDYWVGEDKCERPDLELLGQFLYRVILPTGELALRKKGNLREQFERDYAFFLKTRQTDDRFRLTLELHKEAAELATYPWEFLFMSAGGGFFLAGEKTELILTRFVPNVTPETNEKKEEPLRILVVFSHPQELGNIQSKATVDVVGDIEGLAGERIEVRTEDNPTYEDLYELMNGKDELTDKGKEPSKRLRFKPDIFHFIGHGEPRRLALIRKAEGIQADKDEGRTPYEADWCDTEQVLKLFSNHTPRLVFLHCCDGAKASSIKSLSDMARELVYAKVPIVVAMQYNIKNKDTALFAKTFYEAIRNNSDIDEAVRDGREKLGQREGQRPSWGDRRFGTPVVYMQTNSQRAMVNFPDSREESAAAEIPNRREHCPNPKCDGVMFLNSKFCVYCKEEMMLCPEGIRNKKYHLMVKSLGFCGECGYREDQGA
ncbi:MAG: CHAT domain-containing protein, partial [Acidobacteriota bacterium]|nr:CHAT domain-containing protein [Acidobacteriota bacterium]